MRAKPSDERGIEDRVPGLIARWRIERCAILVSSNVRKASSCPGTVGDFADSTCTYKAKNRHTTPTTPQLKETTMSASARQTKARIRITAITRPDNARWLSLFVLCAGFLMIVVDSTIV